MSAPASASFKIIGGDGREYGPVDLATLQQWMSEGRVTGQTQVWDSRAGRWQSAAQVPEMATALGAAPAPPAVVPVMHATAPVTNTLAVWSISLAVVGLGCCGCVSIPAVVLGAVSLSQIKARREAGRELAIAGIAIGVFSMLIGALCGLLWTLFRFRLVSLWT